MIQGINLNEITDNRKILYQTEFSYRKEQMFCGQLVGVLYIHWYNLN